MPKGSSSRWCPTPEQVMILEEFYRAGVRTPNATQINHITFYLSHHGKIEAKNVFYWFQNHKARRRQKLKKTKNHCHLITQVQRSLHQAPFCTCIPRTSLLSFLNHQEAVAAAKDYPLRMWPMSHNYRSGRNCGGDEPVGPNFLIREYDMSRRAVPAEAMKQTLCFRSPPQSLPPLRTLQLFPVKATHLRKQ